MQWLKEEHTSFPGFDCLASFGPHSIPNSPWRQVPSLAHRPGQGRAPSPGLPGKGRWVTAVGANPETGHLETWASRDPVGGDEEEQPSSGNQPLRPQAPGVCSSALELCEGTLALLGSPHCPSPACGSGQCCPGLG